jgi:hypothetical protein
MHEIKEDDFYIILPSNVGGDLHKDNKTSSFTTHFPNPLLFDGNYEVALTEIHYPHSFLNMFPDVRHPIRLKKKIKGKWKSITVRLKGIFSPDELVMTINDKIRASQNGYETRFEYLPNTHRFRVRVYANEEIHIEGNISAQMGFNFRTMIVRGNGVLLSDNAADLNLLGHILYVYMSCIKQYLVGNQYVRLLRLISVQGAPGDNVYESYVLPYYHDLDCKNINSIDISIRDKTGNLVKFEYGTVICKLHFRKKKE